MAESTPRVRAMACGRVVYHPHARMRMSTRKIGGRQVERTIANPDRLTPSHSNRLVAEAATAAGNTLRVVYEEMEGGSVAFVWTVIRIGGRK